MLLVRCFSARGSVLSVCVFTERVENRDWCAVCARYYGMACYIGLGIREYFCDSSTQGEVSKAYSIVYVCREDLRAGFECGCVVSDRLLRAIWLAVFPLLGEFVGMLDFPDSEND